MKHVTFIVFYLFFYHNLHGQINDCQAGTDSAKSDFSKGILKTYIFGLTNTFTYGKILQDKYGIQVIYWGCIVDEKWDCYSNYMDEKIKEKYGKYFFEEVSKKAQELDSMGKGDRLSTFKSGETGLRKFVYCNLDLTKINYSDDKKGKVYLRFTIDSTGKVANVKILKSTNLNYNNEAIRIINLMPHWTVGTENGKVINQEWNLPIIFDNEWKKKYCH